jgi:hypothetical protein
MQHISKRERTLLRIGFTVAMLLTLWALGGVGNRTIVVY